jgi:capsular polysaccharide biosynthesis protein
MTVKASRYTTISHRILKKIRSILSVMKRKAMALFTLVYNVASMNMRIGFIDSIERWIDTENLKSLPFDCHPTGWYKIFVTESEIFNLDDRIFRQREFRLFNEIRWCLSREVKKYYLDNTYIVGQNAIVMSSDRRIFKQLTYSISTRRWRYEDFLGKVMFPAATPLVGWYTSLACPNGNNFFHWMLECLPRLAALEDYVPLFDGVVIPPNPQPFHYESLAALGVGRDRLIEAFPKLHFKLEHLFATDYSARDNTPPWLHLWYKDKFIRPLNLQANAGRKIYISRADASYRTISNSDEVHAMVSALGFEVVALSRMSFIDQAKLFYTSDVIVGEHGAGLANLVFCRKGSRVIEIFSVYWIAPSNYAIARSAGLEYHFYVAERPEIIALAAEKITSAPITGTLDERQSAAYRVDVNDLQRKILAIINTESVSD